MCAFLLRMVIRQTQSDVPHFSCAGLHDSLAGAKRNTQETQFLLKRRRGSENVNEGLAFSPLRKLSLRRERSWSGSLLDKSEGQTSIEMFSRSV